MPRRHFPVRGSLRWWGSLCGTAVAVFLFWGGRHASEPSETVGQGPAVAGSLAGTVQLETTPPPPPPMLSPYARSRYRPPARPETSPGSPEGVVVFLRAPGLSAGPPGAPVQIVQRNRTIVPHVTAVRVGTRVDFPNDDDVFHNLFSLSGPKSFNLGRYPSGESRSQVFDRPGVVRLFCDIHSEMTAVIVVLDTPYFTHPDAEGRYRIDAVPAGEYTAVAQHDVAGTDSTLVVVRDGEVTSLNFSLGN